MKLVEKYGTPLKFTPIYLKFLITSTKQSWFRKSMEKTNMKLNITIVIALKVLILFIMNEAFKNNIHVETSSALILILSKT
jgi:arginine decarboxylase